MAVVLILHTQDGVIQGQVNYPVLHRDDIIASVSLVLSEHYSNRRPPKTLLVPAPLTDSFTDWLDERRGKKVSIRCPQRGELAKLRGMADANAEIHAVRQSTRRSGSLEQAAAEATAAVDSERADRYLQQRDNLLSRLEELENDEDRIGTGDGNC